MKFLKLLFSAIGVLLVICVILFFMWFDDTGKTTQTVIKYWPILLIFACFLLVKFFSGHEKSLPDDLKFKETHGIGGQLTLLDNKVRISRRGIWAFFLHGLKGDKEILIKHISAIQFKKASMLTNGYIQFAFIGSQESKTGIFGATKDENTVIFTSAQQKNFEEFKSRVEEKMAALEGHKASSIGIDDLEKLADLKQKGIITEEEFLLKKKQILNL